MEPLIKGTGKYIPRQPLQKKNISHFKLESQIHRKQETRRGNAEAFQWRIPDKWRSITNITVERIMTCYYLYRLSRSIWKHISQNVQKIYHEVQRRCTITSYKQKARSKNKLSDQFVSSTEPWSMHSTMPGSKMLNWHCVCQRFSSGGVCEAHRTAR